MNESNRDNPLGSIPINEKQENGKDLPQGLIPPLTPPPSFPRKSDPPSSKPFRVIKWTAFVVLFAVAFYFLAGFLLIPYYLQTFLPKQLEKILDRPINIASTGFNPITLTMTFQNGIVGPKRNSPEDFVDPLLSFGKISVDFELLSFMKKGFIAKSTNIDQLFIHCVRNKENKYNILEISNALQHHLAGTGSLPAGAPLSTGPSLFSLNNLVVTRSSVTFDDLPSGKTHTIKEINLAIPVLTNFSFQMEDLIKPSFSAIINDSPIRMKGDTRIKDDSIEANLELNLTDIDLPEYLAYLPSNSDFLVTKGKADLTLNLTFKTSDKKSQLGIDGAGKISDLRLNDKSGKNLATIPELQISGNFIPLAKTYHITNLVLNNPKILIERDPGGKLNIPVQSPAKEASAASQIKLRIDNILVKNGDLSFIDQSVKGGFAASWKDCGFTFESPASDPAKPASFAVNLRDRDNFGISAQGTFLQSPLTANGLLVIDQFNLERIRPYLDLGDELRLSSGSASKIETNFTYLQHEKQKAPSLLLHGLKTDIKDLAITVDSKDFLHLPFTSIIGGTIAFADKTMHLGQVRTTNGQLILEWPSGPPKPEITSPGKSPLWTFSMDTFSFAKGALDIISPDQNKSSRIRLQNLSLDASGLNNSQNQPGAISGSGQFATKGSIKFSGGITTNPFSTSLDSQLLNVDLSPLQPFLFSWFRPAISQGMLTAEGLITLPDFSFQGTAELADFAAKSKDNPLCEWRMAHGADLFFAAKPMRFTAQNLTFAEPVISWSVKKENLSTFTAVFAHPQSPENLRPIVAINTITVNSGLLKFSDATVLPVYSTSIENITGTLTNLHNRKPDHTGIELKGSMNHNTEIAVSGWLSILEEINSASIHATATALDLPPLSLYLNNLMGGKIDKGKADYAIYLTKEANKLSATNTFRIYDLETSRPIKENASLPLAIALLTEPNNDILLDLTFEDDLADQNFAFRGRITKLFRNILLKTAVNPYSLLATLSSAEIDHILFAFGADTIDEKEKIKLFEIAKILKQRPLLSLDIRGFADNTGDRNAILNTMKEAQKRKLQIRENRLSTELSNSYGREEIGKPLLPQNQTGVEDSPKNSKEPSISNEILTNLAQRRQLAVHDYLVNVGVATNRLSTRVPVSLVPAGAPGRAGNRVDFILVPATFSK